MKVPAKYNADRFKHSVSQDLMELDSGQWVLARPEGFWGACIIDRLSTTLDVFTGKADALYWTDQP